MTTSRVRWHHARDEDARCMHIFPVCPLRSGLGRPSPVPHERRVALATAAPLPLAVPVPWRPQDLIKPLMVTLRRLIFLGLRWKWRMEAAWMLAYASGLLPCAGFSSYPKIW